MHLMYVNKRFLYRPARKAGHWESVTIHFSQGFYTDPHVRRVVFPTSSVTVIPVSIQTRT